MATPITITDAGDPRLDPFRAIRERDLVGRQGRFVAEGDVVMQVLLDTPRFALETVLVSERVAAGGRPWFDRLPATAALLVASDAVIEGIAGFNIHRGIIAIGRRPPEPELAALIAGLPRRASVLVCIGIANHDNMGGLFRNAAAFGAAAVICDATCCDPLYRKAIRVSVGGVFRVPFVRRGAAADIIATLRASGFDGLALSPSGLEALHETKPAPRTALILGAEGPGLAPELMAGLRTLRISMDAGMDSLNVAVSGGIALHHVFNR